MSEHRRKAVEAAEVARCANLDGSDLEAMSDALQAAEPHLQRMYWERVREMLESELAEYKRVAEGAPGEFSAEERTKAWGAVEHCQRQLERLAMDDPQTGVSASLGRENDFFAEQSEQPDIPAPNWAPETWSGEK